MYPPKKPYLRAAIEVGFIVFLFYSNLLMGEFTRSAGQGKTLAVALGDVLTPMNFGIGLAAGLIGYVIFEFLRRKL
jgi:hypothetical protein